MSSYTNNRILSIAEDFKRLEQVHGLFEKKTNDGIFYWDVLRYYAHLAVLYELGYFPNLSGFFKKNDRSRFWKLIKIVRLAPFYLVNELKHFQLKKRSRDVSFLLNSRFEDEFGNPKDSVISDVYEMFKAHSFDMEIFRHKSFSRRRRNIGKRYFLYKLDIDYLTHHGKRDDWGNIPEIINNHFHIDINWPLLFQEWMSRYRVEFNFFHKLFSRRPSKILFYQSQPKGMIAAANALGILTIDVQHGHTNNTTLFYSYPLQVRLNHITSIPKVFLTLGKFWNNIVDFPFLKLAAGNSYFNVCKGAVKGKNGLLIVSVAFTHEYLKNVVANLAKHHSNINFFYKLHSNQKHEHDSTIQYFRSCKNVEIIYTQKNVKEIMEDCFGVLLIQSTVAYQALQMGLKVFILKKFYYEISYDLFAMPGVYLADDWKKLSEQLYLRDINHEIERSPAFFEPFQAKVVEEIFSNTVQ